jgi:hypothetical protein
MRKRPSLFSDITPCNIPEERRPQLHRGGSLISCKKGKIILLEHDSKFPPKVRKV